MNEWVNHWLWKRSVSIGVPLGEHGMGAPLPGTWKVEILSGGFFYWALREICKIRSWKRAGLSVAAALGNLEGGLFYRGLWETDKEWLWKRSFCLWELCEGDVEGPWMICKEGLWKWAFLSIGAPMGELDRDWTELSPESTHVYRMPNLQPKTALFLVTCQYYALRRKIQLRETFKGFLIF